VVCWRRNLPTELVSCTAGQSAESRPLTTAPWIRKILQVLTIKRSVFRLEGPIISLTNFQLAMIPQLRELCFAFTDFLTYGTKVVQSTLMCYQISTLRRYGWRYQIGPWTRKGFRVVVPDMLGYGGTDKPSEYSEYSTKRLSDDLAALLSLLGIDKAVCSHPL